MATEAGRVGQRRCEALDPALDRDVVDLNSAGYEQFLDVAAGQAVAQVPAHRDHDHVGRELEPGKTPSSVATTGVNESETSQLKPALSGDQPTQRVPAGLSAGRRRLPGVVAVFGPRTF